MLFSHGFARIPTDTPGVCRLYPRKSVASFCNFSLLSASYLVEGIGSRQMNSRVEIHWRRESRTVNRGSNADQESARHSFVGSHASESLPEPGQVSGGGSGSGGRGGAG